MKVIGLTGGIAMGKSTAASMIRILGVPVHDSDSAVHELYKKGGGGARALSAIFPEAVTNDAVNRTKLRELVIGKKEELKTLESLVHPLVRQHSKNWLHKQKLRNASLAVLDIPLLFETGRDQECDEVWVVNCPPFLQRQRALGRPGIDSDKLEAILERQVPQEFRLRHADRIFQTGNGRAALLRDLKLALSKV